MVTKGQKAPERIPGSWKLTPQTQDPTTGPILPVDDYPVVRGTVEREQSVGTRAIVVNLVRATGPILLGVGGGITSLNENLTLASGLLAGPFEKGLELVWPDLTVQHLLNLDSHTLRDNVVIANNSAVRVNAFISRELVMCGFPRRWYKLGARSSRNGYDCLDGDTRLPYTQNFDPNDVMERLGKMTLIGQQIQYLNRVRVVQRETSDALGSPLVTNPEQVVEAGSKATNLLFAGLNLQGVTVVATASEIKVSTHTPALNGTTVGFDVDASTVKEGVYALYLLSSHGTTMGSLRVEKPADTKK